MCHPVVRVFCTPCSFTVVYVWCRYGCAGVVLCLGYWVGCVSSYYWLFLVHVTCLTCLLPVVRVWGLCCLLLVCLVRLPGVPCPTVLFVIIVVLSLARFVFCSGAACCTYYLCVGVPCKRRAAYAVAVVVCLLLVLAVCCVIPSCSGPCCVLMVCPWSCPWLACL